MSTAEAVREVGAPFQSRTHRTPMPSLRQPPIQTLASMIAEGKKVVFLTGAGLSAASGIPTFRGQDDSIWVQRATSWGTKQAFLRDPVKWYNSFWFPYFPMKYTKMVPNGGHEALAKLATLSPQVCVVTQNIDTLSQQTREAWNHPEQLIEVHGRMGIYHCSSEEACELATEVYASAADVFGHELAAALDHEEGGGSVRIGHAPLCPRCGRCAMMPLALMFDEDYTSHAVYQFDRAMSWFEAADAIAFVGTSFSVQITNLALAQARQREVPVFNFNLTGALKGQRRFTVHNVLGPAAETLGRLVEAVTARRQALLPASPSAAPITESSKPAARPLPSSPPPATDEAGEAASASTDCKPMALLKDDEPCNVDGKPWRFAVEAAGTPLGRQQVMVELSPAFGRRRHPDESVEGDVEALWAQLRASVPNAFNGLKFRLGQAEVRRGSTAVGTEREKRARTGEEDEALVLRVWLTDYKTFRGTNWSPQAERLRADGRRDHGDSQAYLADKIGVSVAVVTSDGQVVLVQRSGSVSEGQGLWDVPGGHPEPANLGFDAIDTPPPGATPEAVCAEIFDSAVAEVRDEVNLSVEQMGEPQLLGVVRQGNSGGCPSLAFLVRSPCSSEQVQAAYRAGPREAFETTRLLCLPLADVAAGAYPGPLTPSAEGTLLLLGRLTAAQIGGGAS